MGVCVCVCVCVLLTHSLTASLSLRFCCAESARCGGGKVLVHCQAGVSRSPTLVVAYLMARYGRPMMDTFGVVKERRPIVAPNFNFMGQLMEWEQRCRRGEMRCVVDDSVPPPPLIGAASPRHPAHAPVIPSSH